MYPLPHTRSFRLLALLLLCSLLAACTFGFEPLPSDGAGGQTGGQTGGNNPPGETARVINIIDGDTIDVDMNGVTYRVRYVGINTPERDEVCYGEATGANAALVGGRTITMVRDESNTDRYGRLLRYIYADGIFVNAQMVAEGWAEAVEYQPDDAQTAYLRQLEVEARNGSRGCHPTGIFDDRSNVR